MMRGYFDAAPGERGQVVRFPIKRERHAVYVTFRYRDDGVRHDARRYWVAATTAGETIGWFDYAEDAYAAAQGFQWGRPDLEFRGYINLPEHLRGTFG